jgi:deoxyadenosine/deoxycytidine kinase
MSEGRPILTDPWEICPLGADDSPLYVTVIGNSGSGKSSLLKRLAIAMSEFSRSLIAIDESSIHHPFIHRLFFDPDLFALELQFIFMLQRVTAVKHWLTNKHSVLMERSHYDDIIFPRHLLREGHITYVEYESYANAWKTLECRLRKPDLIFFLDVPYEESLRRITEDESTGRRPREFPDEVTKERWITSWFVLYQERFREMQDLNLNIVHGTMDEPLDSLVTRGLGTLGLRPRE